MDGLKKVGIADICLCSGSVPNWERILNVASRATHGLPQTNHSRSPMADSIRSCPDQHEKGASLSLEYESRPLYHVLDDAAKSHGHRAAVVFKDSTLTYSELLEQAERIAAALAEAGIAPGDRVAVLLPNLPELVAAFWGILKAGAVIVLSNPLYTEQELRHNLADAGARALISHERLWPKVDGLRESLGLVAVFLVPDAETRSSVPYDGKRVFPWSALVSGKRGLSVPIPDPRRDLALLQYTGGTTGVPKGAMISHYNILSNVRQIEAVLRLRVEEHHVFLAVLPLFHIYALTICVGVGAAVAGAVAPFPRFSPREVLQGIQTHRPTVFPGAPSLYIALLHQKDLSEYDLSSLRYCICGSAPMPFEYLRQFEEKTGAVVMEGYGLTEASPVTHLNTARKHGKPGSIGLPLPDTDAKIVDMDVGDLTLKTGVPGELIVRGPQVSLGYWNLPDETANTFRNNWLFTGDIAQMDEEGYFTIVDRKKDMVIVGGYKVYPREIDEVLHEHPLVKEAISVGMSHPTRGEVIKAFIVPVDGAKLSAEEVLAHCRKRLANYKIPRAVEFRDELPKSAVGKVLRRLLCEREHIV